MVGLPCILTGITCLGPFLLTRFSFASSSHTHTHREKCKQNIIRDVHSNELIYTIVTGKCWKKDSSVKLISKN